MGQGREELQCRPQDVNLLVTYAHRRSCSVLQRSRQEDYICPFIVTGKRLTELLLDILDVGKKVDENSLQYLPMFYQSRGSAFEEVCGWGRAATDIAGRVCGRSFPFWA